MATSRILLISNADEGAVAAALEGPNHVVTRADDAVAAIASGSGPDVVVIDLGRAAQEIVNACRAIREAPDLGSVPILAIAGTDDVEERIRLLEAGVDDVLSRPFDARELEARIESLVLRNNRSRDLASGSSEGSVVTFRDGGMQRLIAVFSPKGGVGTTTVAVNVASSLAARAPGQVVILDLDVQFGQVATHLNLAAKLTIADLANDTTALRDGTALQPYLDRHASGLLVLPAPATPDGASGVLGSTVDQLLETARRTFQFVVVDAGSTLDERAESVLARATDIVVVVTPDFPAIKAVHSFRELLSAGGGQAETSYVLNHIFSREILRLRDIEEALETKVALTIPYDAFAFLKSVNEGVPVVIGASKTAAAEQLGHLAARLGGFEAAAPVEERRPKGLGALFGRG